MRQAPNGPAMTRNIPDYLDFHNAQALATRIRLYWQVRGYPYVKVYLESISLVDKFASRAAYVVRSDMVGGLPR